MSLWRVRLLADGGRTPGGELVDRSTRESLAPLLAAAPVCIQWTHGGLNHPTAAGGLAPDVDPAAIVGSVRAAWLVGDGIVGEVSISDPHLDLLLLNAERTGRLAEGFGLSVRGRALAQPRDDGEVVLVFGCVLAVDVVEVPSAGGCFLQSDAAASAGAPCPVPPTLTLLPRPAPRPPRESSSSSAIRYAHTAPRSRREPIDTDLPIIRPGEDYTPWN